MSQREKTESVTPSKYLSEKSDLSITPLSAHGNKSSTPVHGSTQPGSPEKSRIRDLDDDIEESVLDQSSQATEQSSRVLLRLGDEDDRSIIDSVKDSTKDEVRDRKDSVNSENVRKDEELKLNLDERTDRNDYSETFEPSETQPLKTNRTETDIPEESIQTDRTDKSEQSESGQLKLDLDKSKDENETVKQTHDETIEEIEREEVVSARSESVHSQRSEEEKEELSQNSRYSSQHSEQSLSQQSEPSYHYTDSEYTVSQSDRSERTESQSDSRSHSVTSQDASKKHMDKDENTERIKTERTEAKIPEKQPSLERDESIAESIPDVEDKASVGEDEDSPQLKLDLTSLKDAVAEKQKEEEAEKVDTPRMMEDLDLEKIGAEMEDDLPHINIGKLLQYF